MLEEAKALQHRAVKELLEKTKEDKKELTFKAPTGCGKTHMMAEFMDAVLKENPSVVFLVSAPSVSELAWQNYKAFEGYQEQGSFPYLLPYYIDADVSSEESVYISENENVFVFPIDLYKKGSKIMESGSFDRWLDDMTKYRPDKKEIWLINDECHKSRKNIQAKESFFLKIINFSATPDLKKGQRPDVEITEAEAVSAGLIKKVETGSDTATLDEALCKFEEIRKEYHSLLGINPCFIIQVSNKGKVEDELENIVFPALKKHDLKWMYIVTQTSGASAKQTSGVNAKECRTNDEGLQKISPSRWKDYAKKPSSTIDVIIFKLSIKEGWDIPRACMLYQIRDTESKTLDEQVMGRVRRNPRLLDFETLNKEQRDLCSTAYIYGIIPKEYSLIAVEPQTKENISVKTTKLKTLKESVTFDVSEFLEKQEESDVHDSIFSLYKGYEACTEEVRALSEGYVTDAKTWRRFMENLSGLKAESGKFICDYEKSMEVSEKDASLPQSSFFDETEHSFSLSSWIWRRNDKKTDFSFDSKAEEEWARILDKLAVKEKIKEEKISDREAYMWAKNFLNNSEIGFEYYLNGIHTSFPDFILKDKNDGIHLFEVKSMNESGSVSFNTEDYKNKIKALKDAYRVSSKLLPEYFFYFPVLTGSTWNIEVIHAGKTVREALNEETFLKEFPCFS